MEEEPRTDDVMELGPKRSLPPGLRSLLPGWRPSRGAGILAAAALIAGLAAGYAAGYWHARVTPLTLKSATPTASSLPIPDTTFSFFGSPPLTQGLGACSLQAGRELQLGIQLTNQSTAPLALETAKTVLPLGGLKAVAQQWAPCGAISDGPASSDLILEPGDSAWLTVTFQVRTGCPAPLPVQFTVGYQVQGHQLRTSLHGFSDLGQVPYSGCPATTAVTWNLTQISGVDIALAPGSRG